jgi:uncharacterized membrane protein YtjA (UPF0391 family)
VLLFFAIFIVAGILGFTGISAAAGGIARMQFNIFIVAFIVFLVLGLLPGETIFYRAPNLPPRNHGLDWR